MKKICFFILTTLLIMSCTEDGSAQKTFFTGAGGNRLEKMVVIKNAAGDTLAMFSGSEIWLNKDSSAVSLQINSDYGIAFKIESNGNIALYDTSGRKAYELDATNTRHLFYNALGDTVAKFDTGIEWHNLRYHTDFNLGGHPGSPVSGALRNNSINYEIYLQDQWRSVFDALDKSYDAISAFPPADSGAVLDTLSNLEEVYVFDQTNNKYLVFIEYPPRMNPTNLDSIKFLISTPSTAGDSCRFRLDFAVSGVGGQIADVPVLWQTFQFFSNYVEFPATSGELVELNFDIEDVITLGTNPVFTKLYYRLTRINSISNNVQDDVRVHAMNIKRKIF